jgi:hypothetical protein
VKWYGVLLFLMLYGIGCWYAVRRGWIEHDKSDPPADQPSLPPRRTVQVLPRHLRKDMWVLVRGGNLMVPEKVLWIEPTEHGALASLQGYDDPEPHLYEWRRSSQSVGGIGPTAPTVTVLLDAKMLDPLADEDADFTEQYERYAEHSLNGHKLTTREQIERLVGQDTAGDGL